MTAVTSLALKATSLGVTADLIIKIGAVVAALLTIWGAVVKIKKPIDDVVEKLDKLDKQNTENYLCCLKLTIMSTEMPLSERIAAGDKYIELGGNGAVRHKYQELLAQLGTDERSNDK